MVNFANELAVAIIVILNAGAGLRIASNILAAQDDDTVDYKRRNKQLIKALIIINCLSGLVAIIRTYYE